MIVSLPEPIVAVRDVLPSLGFIPKWGTATDEEPAYAFKEGGIDLVVAQVTGWHLRPEFLIGGVASNSRVMSYVEQAIPLAVESRDQIVAWLAFAVGVDFVSRSPVSWFAEGINLQHLLPWVREAERLREEAKETARLRRLRPHCTVERHWLRKLLNASVQSVGQPPLPGKVHVTFDGEFLKLYVRGQVIGVPGLGTAWGDVYQGNLEHLLMLPRRLTTDPIEVGIWRGNLEIERVQIPVRVENAALSS